MRRIPRATYRLQFNRAFTFAHAERILPYLKRLGVSDLYCSPIFTARPGSTHGYDVIDPNQINPELGGREGFERLARAAQQHEMGVILDIVPNHVAASAANPWWRDVLQHGQASRFARFFDIKWDRGGGKVILPMLGQPLEETIAAGEIEVRRDGEVFEVRYFEHRLPISPQSAKTLRGERRSLNDREVVRTTLDAQHYRLAFWRDAVDAVNYRRFFDISDLVGVHVEDRDVFHETHALVPDLVRSRLVMGLRIDHIDGLRDPLSYLQNLRALCGQVYVVVEKILSGDEQLRREWPVQGTTGYEFLNALNHLFIQPQGARTLVSEWAQAMDMPAAFDYSARAGKLFVIQHLFAGDVAMLADAFSLHMKERSTSRQRDALLEDQEMAAALRELMAALPVYRTYIRDEAQEEDLLVIQTAHASASRHVDATGRRALDAITEAICCASIPDFIHDWQQRTGPVTAKGIEDTALYRHTPLLSMNEVGGEPVVVNDAVAAFHRFNQSRLKLWPHTLNATSTHDTKRGEDARARINVLSEVADDWLRACRRWRGMNGRFRRGSNECSAPTVREEHALYQTLIGSFPLEGVNDSFIARVEQWIIKAAREAKENTSWLDPDEAHESALKEFVRAILGSRDFLNDFTPFAQRIAFHGMLNGLSQTLLKLTSPGVPDIYQGCERWNFSMVDPDNRRPVDFDDAARCLDEQEEDNIANLLTRWHDGAIKQRLTLLALHCRAQHPELFANGDYLPLEAHGNRAAHIVAFARQDKRHCALVVASRWTIALCEQPSLSAPYVAPRAAWPTGASWEDTALMLPPGLPQRWQSAIDRSQLMTPIQAAPVKNVLRVLPVALLIGER